MNPLSELKERLIYLTVAGTQLLSEDFRLKRTAESIAPLAEKNPVWKKIHQELQKLLTCPDEQQGSLLLGLLGLIDAVLYTQADYQVEGEPCCIPARNTITRAAQSRYSEIAPILQALSSTGSGRLEVLQTAILQNPTCLRDYRIINALIHDLDDPYGEMGKLVYQTLLSMGSGAPVQITDPQNIYKERRCVLPQADKLQLVSQLKQGFDPQGRLEMAKRLHIISCTAKGRENDWYLSLLDASGKEIRQEAIRALRWREENIPILLDLLRKERTKRKEVIYEVLGIIDAPELLDVIREELFKNIKSVKYLRNSSSDDISDLVAQFLRADIARWMDYPKIAGEEYEKLCCYKLALQNKASDQLLDLYRYLIENSSRLPKVYDENNNSQSFEVAFLSTVANELKNILLVSCPCRLVNFFRSFTRKPRNVVSPVFVFADLLTLPKEEAYEVWHKESFDTLLAAFQYVDCNDRTYQLWNWSSDEGPFYRDVVMLQRDIREPLDARWFELFLKKKQNQILYQLGPHCPQEMKGKIADYFYQNMMKPFQHHTFDGNSFYHTLDALKIYGWTDWRGILSAQLKNCPQIAPYYWSWIFARFSECAPPDVVHEEAKSVVALYDQYYQGGPGAIEMKRTLTQGGFYIE